jgi:hypothetical protein
MIEEIVPPKTNKYGWKTIARNIEDGSELWETPAGKYGVYGQGGKPRISTLFTEEAAARHFLEKSAGEKKYNLDNAAPLEEDVERYLINNLDKLEPGLKLYISGGKTGHQFVVSVNEKIDILAIDGNEDYVVIEIKRGKANDEAFGQIVGYISYVKHAIADEHHVRGIIVANSFSGRLKYAVKAMPDVILKQYAVNFEFSDVDVSVGTEL